MKIYIFADQEGVAGVFNRREGYLNASEYATMELAAICEALLDNGVDEIVLNTIHTMEYHKLPKPVQIIHGLPRHDIFTELLDESFDAGMLVGFHEMAGNREKGCWRHSILPHPITRAYSAVEGIWLNDLLVGEIGIFVALAGIHNVPAVLNTGDYWACLEAEDLVPGIETVAVKKGTSHFSAISMTPQAAAEAAAEGAVRALGKIGVVKPLKIEGPVTLKVKYTFAERATDAMSTVAGAFRIDEQTVAATYPSIAAVRDNLGNLRAPEMEIYAKDSGFSQTTGFFTRTGGEPYESTPTYPPPSR